MKSPSGGFENSAEFLNLLMDNLTSAIFIVDRNARIVNVNDTAQVLFERKSEDFIGKFCGNGIKCQYVAETGQICGKTEYCADCILRAGILETVAKKQNALHRKLVRSFYIDGQKVEKHLLFSTKLIPYNGDEMVLLIIDDVSEIEEQRLRLEELNKVKNRFLGIAAHDLRNPLGAINIYASYLKEDLKTVIKDEHKEFLESIINSTRFMNHLIKELLTISQIESGALNLIIERNDYHQLLSHCVIINKVIAGKKGIKIIIEDDENIPEFRFDRYKVEQVLNNLISNAVKFSNPDTEVIIKTELSADYVKTSVIDRGPGISEDEIPRLFQEFHPGKNRPTAGEDSTGLGLMITKKIIEGHKGVIGIESRPGGGSVFYFTLPLENG